jgi:alpha-tubulin suppressor-like RCC1 family protein
MHVAKGKWLRLCTEIAVLALLVAVLAEYLRQPAGIEVGKALPPGKVRPQLVNTWSMAWLVAPDGSLWGWGDPSYFLWGSPAKPAITTLPQRIGSDTNWMSVAASINTALGLKDDGSLWTWGWNFQSGLAQRRNPAPTRFGTETNWVQVAAGAFHCLALKNDGSLWAWGQNGMGQLGDGTTNNRINPVLIGTNSDWGKILANQYFTSVALKTNNTIWAWGQLDVTNRLTPTQISADTNWLNAVAGAAGVLALKSDGTLWGQVPPKEALEQIGHEKDWKEIYSAVNFFFIRKQDGSWWKWGVIHPRDSRPRSLFLSLTDGGSLDYSHPPERCPFDFDPWAFAPGGVSDLVLTKDGALWEWGVRVGSGPGPARTKMGTLMAPVTRRFPDLGQLFEPTVDQQPYRLWELPPEVRRSLGTGPGSPTNSSTTSHPGDGSQVRRPD